MAEKVKQTPSFGTFGAHIYNTEDSPWLFTRDLDEQRVLRPLYSPQLGSSNRSCQDEQPEHQHVHRALRHRKEIRALIKAFPELQPADALLEDLTTVSEAVLHRAATHDPLRGAWLAYATLYDRSQHGTTPVIAWVSGETGGNVSVAKVVQQRHGWNDTPNAWIEAPAMESVSHYRGPGAPIQQVRLAQPVASGRQVNLLAVRMLTCTRIFHLALQSNHIDFEEVLEITIDEPGGNSHMDVSFNPYFAKQVAVVDAAGQVAIWELDGRRHERAARIMWHEALVTSSSALNDGWHRVAWVGGPLTLIIASRSDVVIHHGSKTTRPLVHIDAGLDRAYGYVADIATYVEEPELLFLLTSTHLMAFRIEIKEDRSRHAMIWRTRHYASPDDLTLSLSLLSSLEGLMIILSSRARYFSNFYLMADSGEDERHDYFSGPHSFVRPSLGREIGACNMHLLPVTLKTEAGYIVTQNSFEPHRKVGKAFYSLLYLSTGFDVRSEVYSVFPDFDTNYALKQSDRIKAKRKKRATLLSPDSEEEHDQQYLHESSQANEDHQQKLAPTNHWSRPQTLRKWINNLEHSAHALEVNTDVELLDISAVLARAASTCAANPSVDGTVTQLLSEIDKSTLTVANLDAADKMLNDVMLSSQGPRENTADEELRIGETVLERLHFGKPTQDLVNQVSVPAIYDSTVSEWISSLSPSIPLEVRLAKEIHARQITAQVSLASHILRVKQQSSREEPPAEDSEDELDLPTFSQRSHSVSQTPSRRASVAPSQITSTSRASSHSLYEIPPFSLQNHLSIGKPLPTTLSRPLQRVLRHWDLAADPADYDYRARSRQVTRQVEEEEADSQLTEREREKLRRATERYMRRQRREAEASQAQQSQQAGFLASSQAIDLLLSASQPMPHRTQQRESHAGAGPSASQAVPGRHGGRAPVKKRRRKQGF